MLTDTHPYRVMVLDLLYRILGVFNSIISDRLGDTAVATCYWSGRNGYAGVCHGQDREQQERLRPVPLAG